MSLRLYQKIICGEWFNNNDKYNNLLKEKYQRRIMKMANQMIMTNGNGLNNGNGAYLKRHYSSSTDIMDSYIPYLFESMTKNVSFGRKMIWLNKKDCDLLLPQFKQLLFEGG